MQGELYLARSQRRRIRPLPIPADLQAAMTDPNMFTRLGAVTELRSRLTSDNLPAAAGARDALADMARTDIQYLAEAAATALREVEVHTAERELHFGQVAKDSSPTPRTVHLLGPPLARACTFQASDSWIRIDETTDGIHVSVDTSQAGTLRGDITVKGPTGDTMIPVDVEVTPGPEPPPPASANPVDTTEPRPATTPPSASTLRQSPEPAVGGPSGFPTSALAELSIPPTSVPEATASSTPTRASSPAGWHVPSRPTHVATILTGIITLLSGVDARGSYPHNPLGVSLALHVSLIVYVAFRLVQSFATGEVGGGRRKWPLIVGVLALLVLVLAVPQVLALALGGVPDPVAQPRYLAVVSSFWVIVGVIEVVVAIRGSSRPTRRLEIVSGVLGASAGILATVFAALSNARGVIVTLGNWLFILGIILLIVGFKQRDAARDLARSGAGSGGGDPHAPGS